MYSKHILPFKITLKKKKVKNIFLNNVYKTLVTSLNVK